MIYHGSEGGGPIEQAGSANPRFSRGNPVERDDRERPGEEELKPDQPDKEMWLLRNQIVAVFFSVPGLEVHQGCGVEV